MNVWTILIAVAAIAGIVYFFPRLPRLGQIVGAIVLFIACALVLLKLSGVDMGLNL